MKFLLNCWVPSLNDYIKISELTMYQLELVSKYLINEDHAGASECFDFIIKENLHNKDLFEKLNRLDKWFILSFLKCNNISPLIIIKAKTEQDADCTIDFNLVDILTQASEYQYKFNSKVEIRNFEAFFYVPTQLYSTSILLDAVEHIKLDAKIVKIRDLSRELQIKFFANVDISLPRLLESYLALQDANNDFYLLKNTSKLKNMYDVKLNMFDNTLFYFLKSIYLPYAKSLYLKKYNLINKVGFSLNEIGGLTPFEADIYLNIFGTEEKALSDKSTATL